MVADGVFDFGKLIQVVVEFVFGVFKGGAQGVADAQATAVLMAGFGVGPDLKAVTVEKDIDHRKFTIEEGLLECGHRGEYDLLGAIRADTAL